MTTCQPLLSDSHLNDGILTEQLGDPHLLCPAFCLGPVRRLAAPWIEVRRWRHRCDRADLEAVLHQRLGRVAGGHGLPPEVARRQRREERDGVGHYASLLRDDAGARASADRRASERAHDVHRREAVRVGAARDALLLLGGALHTATVRARGEATATKKRRPSQGHARRQVKVGPLKVGYVSTR